MRVAICDDEPAALEHASTLLRRYAETHGVSFEISRFLSGIALMDELDRGQRFDCYLLDIIMPGLDGMGLAASIRHADESALLIFLTSTPEFAVDSYDVAAFGYLLKPVSAEKLTSTLDRAMRVFSRQDTDCILVQSGGCLLSLPRRNIVCVEVQRDKLLYRMTDGTAPESYGTMSEAEKQFLSDRRFLKPHRSFLINMEHVRELRSRDLIMDNGCSVPVARGNLADIKSAYISYMVEMAGRRDDA